MTTDTSKPKDYGYPRIRAPSPIFRPSSLHISRTSTPRLVASTASVSPLTSPGSESDGVGALSISRASTPANVVREPCGNSTDDSERVVERLLAVDSTATTSKASSATPPSPLPGGPESSPGYAWKRTVLIPTDRAWNLPTNVSFPIPTSYQYDPRRRAPMTSARHPFTQSLSSVLALPAHPSLPVSTPPPIAAPIPRSPVKFVNAGWDTSDTDSP